MGSNQWFTPIRSLVVDGICYQIVHHSEMDGGWWYQGREPLSEYVNSQMLAAFRSAHKDICRNTPRITLAATVQPPPDRSGVWEREPLRPMEDSYRDADEDAEPGATTTLGSRVVTLSNPGSDVPDVTSETEEKGEDDGKDDEEEAKEGNEDPEEPNEVLLDEYLIETDEEQ